MPLPRRGFSGEQGTAAYMAEPRRADAGPGATTSLPPGARRSGPSPAPRSVAWPAGLDAELKNLLRAFARSFPGVRGPGCVAAMGTDSSERRGCSLCF